MALDDLRDFLDQPTLTLPVGGREYVVKPCLARVFLRLQEASAAAASGDTSGERIPDTELFRLSLGDELFEELADALTGPELVHVGTTAYMWQLGRSEIAEVYWASGGKALTASETPTPTPQATHTGEATTTRRRASGSGTSTRKKNSASAKG